MYRGLVAPEAETDAPDRATVVSPRPRGGKHQAVGTRRGGRIALMAFVVLALATAADAMARVVVAGSRAAPPDLPAALTVLAAGASALLLTWLAISVVLTTAAELLPRRRLARAATATTPAVVRRLVCLALGAAVAGGTLAPATAEGPPAVVAAAPVPDPLDPAWAVAPATGAVGTAGALDPGWTPAAPAPAPRKTTSPGLLAGVPQQVTEPEEVVVRRGDTLWDLAARVLPLAATDAEIAAEWPHWYAANVAVIGPDPDLLLPGQRLRVPAETARAQR